METQIQTDGRTDKQTQTERERSGAPPLCRYGAIASLFRSYDDTILEKFTNRNEAALASA